MNIRNLTLTIALISIGFLANAQSGFGIKAGIGYNTNGELKEFFNETGTIIDEKGKGKSSYNVGVFGKFTLGPVYVRPELVYTKTTSEYILNSQYVDYKVAKLDMPVLIGVKVVGPLSLFAGPSFQYYLENDLEGLEYESIKNEFSVGVNLGASLEFGKFGIDVRYERGLSQNEVDFLDVDPDYMYRLDSRPEQIIFNLSYRFSGGE